MIDFALSNFANAGYRKIVVLTQYKSHSLDRHITQTWRFSAMLDDYVTPVPAQMRRGPHWFQGSADAIYQNLNLIQDERPDIVVRVRCRPHLPHGSAPDGRGAHATTMPASPSRRSRCRSTRHAISASSRSTTTAGSSRSTRRSTTRRRCRATTTLCLASMGNYVFNTETLIDIVTPGTNQYTDLGGDVIPALTACGRRPGLRLLEEHDSRPGRSRARATGATSARSTRSSTPTWT